MIYEFFMILSTCFYYVVSFFIISACLYGGYDFIKSNVIKLVKFYKSKEE